MNKTCKYFGKCGGCQIPNLDYPAQLSMKMRKMISVMGKRCRVDEIVGMEDPYHYRTKVQAAFQRMGDGMRCGIYQSSSGHVIPVRHCLLEDETAQKIRRTVEEVARSLSLTVYNPQNGRGLLRHVLVRYSRATDQALVALVTGNAPFPKEHQFVEELLAAAPAVRTIVRCINTTDVAMYMGEETIPLYGNGYMEEIIGGKRFAVSARAFLQVNPTQTEKLYRLALENAALTGRETVLDAYCGVGTLGILAAPQAAHVIGVEINEDAVHDAACNAALNHIDNAEFFAADAAEFMQKKFRSLRRPDVVFLDPPRAGCSRPFLSALSAMSPEKIVYVSCNPDTLGRDAMVLSKAGYQVTRVTPVDMFPFTTHIESVTCFEKRSPAANTGEKQGGGRR